MYQAFYNKKSLPLQRENHQYNVLVDIIITHRREKLKRDRKKFKELICGKIKSGIRSIRETRESPARLSRKKFGLKEHFGVDRKFTEALFFSKILAKSDQMGKEVEGLSKIKVQKSKPEKAFNDLIFKLNSNSVAKSLMESLLIDKESTHFKKKLGGPKQTRFSSSWRSARQRRRT